MLWDELLAPSQLGQELWEWNGAGFDHLRVGDHFEKARRAAAGLRRLGVEPGSIVPAVITNGPDASPGFVGIWFAGAAVASLPIIARGMSVESYIAQLGEICAFLGATFFLAEERFLEFMPDDAQLAARPVGYRELIETADLGPVEPPEPRGTIFVQFSSGTTGEPRGVELTGIAIEAQLKALAEQLHIDPEHDIGYMWLPLSHDMGFFGCNMLAWYTGMRGVRSTPERFLQSPRSWFEECARFGASVTAGPPSAVQLAARAERAAGSAAPLRLRLCLVGAEPVEWDVLAAGAEALAPRGFGLETFTLAYGLAEATLAVTVGDVAGVPERAYVDAEALAHGRVEEADEHDDSARAIVSAGRPLPGTTVRIDAASSEIVVRSPSLGLGYLRDPFSTGERFQDGAVRTGDLGFVRDGELFVVGRADDLLIVGGRNIHVQMVEVEMEAEPGIRKGNCAIVEHRHAGRARIGIVAELTSSVSDEHAVSDRLRQIAQERVGLSIDDVLFLERGAFPKTPSGKVQRFRCRDLLRQQRGDVR